ncbi:MAG: hypothetical protein HY897_14500, partial [Deltaproteobacteria bacterium]|nr:hypothetical protein [Deltaproteobacteria bacterium]
SGTLTAAWNSQAANLMLASPDGAAGAPVFRALTDADIPDTITASSYSLTSHNHDATYVNEGQADSITATMVAFNYAGSSSEGGGATTALALNANGGNCPAGQYPLGVDESGNAESCTAAGTGTVTNVATGTGLTGGPITTTGTISLSTPVSIANGGTGAITASAALSNLGGASLTAANTFTVGPQTIQTGADANKGLIVKANSATQSAKLQEWQNSAGTAVASSDAAGKLTVVRVDPPVKINGKWYATYGWEGVGLRTDVVGETRLENGRAEIDIAAQPEASDLWLFYNVVAEDTIVPFVSAQDDAVVTGRMKGTLLKIKSLLGKKDALVRYRLSGKRIDMNLPAEEVNVRAEEGGAGVDVDKYRNANMEKQP